MRRQTTTPEEPTMDDTSDLTSDVSRRRFLAGAGVAAGTVAVASTLDLAACSRSTGSASLPPEPIEHGVLDSLVTARAPRLSIGFIERSAGHATLAAALQSKVRSLPAAELRTGSLGLAGRAVQVHVLGLTPGGEAALSARDAAVLLDVLVPAAGGATLPFFAWSFRSKPAPATASPMAFRVAAARSHRFAIRVEARARGAATHPAHRVSPTSQAAVAGSAVQVLTSGFGRNLAKLRPGIYLVGIDHARWDQARDLPAIGDPSWKDHPSVVVSVSAAS